MSTNNSDFSLDADPSDMELLQQLIRAEMNNIRIRYWGFFFPCHVAAWRFIEAKRPGILGPLKAGFDSEPYFAGKGAPWFVDVLGDKIEYLDLLEAIMYPITRDAPAAVLDRVRARGFFRHNEIPPLDSESVERLAQLILAEVDEADRNGLIK